MWTRGVPFKEDQEAEFVDGDLTTAVVGNGPAESPEACVPENRICRGW